MVRKFRIQNISAYPLCVDSFSLEECTLNKNVLAHYAGVSFGKGYLFLFCAAHTSTCIHHTFFILIFIISSSEPTFLYINIHQINIKKHSHKTRISTSVAPKHSSSLSNTFVAVNCTTCRSSTYTIPFNVSITNLHKLSISDRMLEY